MYVCVHICIPQNNHCIALIMLVGQMREKKIHRELK